MKNFYLEREPEYTGDMENKYKQKRERVLEVIKPICDAFEITDYDYICNSKKEHLLIEGQEIGCRSNSIGATVMELVNYIWINIVAENRSFCFQNQCLNSLRRHWIN